MRSLSGTAQQFGCTFVERRRPAVSAAATALDERESADAPGMPEDKAARCQQKSSLSTRRSRLRPQAAECRLDAMAAVRLPEGRDHVRMRFRVEALATVLLAQTRRNVLPECREMPPTLPLRRALAAEEQCTCERRRPPNTVPATTTNPAGREYDDEHGAIVVAQAVAIEGVLHRQLAPYRTRFRSLNSPIMMRPTS